MKKKSPENTSAAKRLIGYLKPYRKKVALLLICAVVGVIFLITGPRVLGTATNVITMRAQYNQTGVLDLDVNDPGLAGIEKIRENVDAEGIYVGPPLNEGDMPVLKMVLMILVAIYGLSALFTYLQQKITAQVAQRAMFDLRENVDRKIQRLPLNYYDTHTHGDVLSRTTTDIETISTSLQQIMTQLLTAIFTIIGIVIMMFTLNWQMALIALVVLPVALFVCSRIAKKSQTFFKGQQEGLGAVNSYVEEHYAGHDVLKLYGGEKRAEREFDEMNDTLNENARRAQFASSIMMPATNLVGNLGYVGICILGGLLTAGGSLTIGAIQAFLQYMQQFTQPIIQTSNIVNMMQSTLAAAERVFEFLDEPEIPEERKNAVRIEKNGGNITFEHVKFGYSPDRILITDMNAEIRHGQKVGICGPTGAGKTTLINLLMRFYDLNGGAIRIDGVDATEMTRQNVRSLFGMVLQDTWLYSASIRDNIRYGRPEATDEEVEEACRMANADYFIRTLPDGYDTVIDESAGNLSSGQKQLLTIARAFCADPQILILDEATSSVDTRTEKLMTDAMKKLTEGRTNFQIAHRLSTIFDADLILVLKDGDLVEQGTHDELMKIGGVYAALYNSQFS